MPVYYDPETGEPVQKKVYYDPETGEPVKDTSPKASAPSTLSETLKGSPFEALIDAWKGAGKEGARIGLGTLRAISKFKPGFVPTPDVTRELDLADAYKRTGLQRGGESLSEKVGETAAAAVPSLVAGLATGGASLPAQMAAQGVSAAATTALQGGSNEAATKDAALASLFTGAAKPTGWLLKKIAPFVYGRGLAKPKWSDIVIDAKTSAERPLTRTDIAEAALESGAGAREGSLRKVALKSRQRAENINSLLEDRKSALLAAEDELKKAQATKPTPVPPDPTYEHLKDSEWAKRGGRKAQMAYLRARGLMPDGPNPDAVSAAEETVANAKDGLSDLAWQSILADRRNSMLTRLEAAGGGGKFFDDPITRTAGALGGYMLGGPHVAIPAALGLAATSPFGLRSAGWSANKLANLLMQYPQLAGLSAAQLDKVLNGLEYRQ